MAILGLFETPTEGHGMWWHNFPSDTHSAGKVTIWWQSNTCSYLLSKHSKLTQSNTQYVSNFKHGDPSVSEGRVLHSVHIVICFACQWTSCACAIFSRDHITSELEHPLKNLCSPYSLLTNSFQHLTFCSTVLSSLKHNLLQTCSSFKSTIF